MHAWLIARMFNFSRGNACVSQSNSFHASLTAPALANQIAFMLTSEEREAQKKRWRTDLRRWSYLYLKVVCFDFFFFCLDFLKVTEKYTLYNVKTPLIVTEKYV